MLNISPIGRSCTLEERIEFSEIDKVKTLHFNDIIKDKDKLDGYVRLSLCHKGLKGRL